MCTSENNSYGAWISFKTLVVVVGGWNKQVTSRMNPTALGSSTPEPPLAFICHTSVDTTQFEAFDVIHLPKTKLVTHKKLRNWDMTSSIYFLLSFERQILLTDGYLHFRQYTCLECSFWNVNSVNMSCKVVRRCFHLWSKNSKTNLCSTYSKRCVWWPIAIMLNFVFNLNMELKIDSFSNLFSFCFEN